MRTTKNDRQDSANGSIQKGKQSLVFHNPVYISASASVVGEKEGNGPLGQFFDLISTDNKLGGDTWEEAESNFQKNALRIAIRKAGIAESEIRYLLCGDLLGQCMASTFGTGLTGIPMFGVYGACSTCGEALGLGSILVDGGFADRVACVTSSHFASAEKEFRYPLDYGNQRPLSASWTVCGSGAFILSRSCEPVTRAKITGITTGKVTDYAIKDALNMGACMAPAAADTLKAHFEDMGTKPEDYDQIITGDLGAVGKEALLHLMQQEGYPIAGRHMDCGIEIFGWETDPEKASSCGQDTHSGGSGCGCSAAVLSAYLLEKLERGDWKRILFVPTGALLSKTSFNEGRTIPGIAHVVMIEHIGK